MKNILLKISVIDKVTAPIQKMQKTFENVKKSVNGTQRKLKVLPNSIQGLENKLSRLREKQRQAFTVKGIKHYNREIKKTERELAKLNKKAGLTKRSLSNMVIGGGAIYTAYSGLKQIVSLSAKMEQTKVAFETMLGSEAKASSMLNDLNKMAAKTPFDNTVLYDNAKLLLNFGMDQASILPTLKMLGDVSGGSKEKLDSLTLAFAQIQSQGKLTGQDLLQMINAGFNPLQEISKMTGKSMAELKDEMSKGAITSDMVTKAFQHATGEGGRFYKMMEKQSGTLAGQFSTIIGNLKLFAVQIGNALMPVIKKLAGITMKFVNFLLEHKGLAKAIGIGIMAVAGALAIWLPLQWAINLALTANPIGLIVMGIAALIAGIIFLIVKIEKVYSWWKKIRAILFIISPMLAFIIEIIMQLAKAINYVVKYGFDGLKLWLQELLNEAIGIVNKIIAGINKVLGTNIKAIGEIHWVDKAELEKQRQDKKGTNDQTATSGMLTPADIGGGNTTQSIIPGGTGGQVTTSNNISAITGGGTKPTNINVTFDKMIETLTIAADNLDEGLNEMKDKVEDILMRILNSAAEIAH